MISIKPPKFFLSTIIITICALLYVHQNVEILKVGYSIDTNQKAFSYFLDRHRRLVYNLAKLKSPPALEERLLAEEIELIEPGANNVYYASAKIINKPSPEFRSNNGERIIDKILDTFTEKAEARVR